MAEVKLRLYPEYEGIELELVVRLHIEPGEESWIEDCELRGSCSAESAKLDSLLYKHGMEALQCLTERAYGDAWHAEVTRRTA